MTYVTILLMPGHDPINDPESMSDQALTWLTRLQKGDLSKAERQCFHDWCKSDPKHQQAYDQAEQFWQLLDSPAKAVHDRLLAQSLPKAPRKAFRPGFAQAACFILVIVGLSTLLPNLIQDWQSDYVTATGERQVVELTDGSRMTLNTDSAVAVTYAADQRRITLVRGEAYFEVASNKSRPFIVQAGSLSARAVGTAFSVALFDENKKEVAVSEGVVAVTDGGQNQQLTANQHISWHEGKLETVQSDDSENRLAWRRGQVVFYRQPLAQVIKEVNRYRRWPILIANRALAKRIISGVFKTDDPNTVISALTHTLSAQAVSLPGGAAVLY